MNADSINRWLSLAANLGVLVGLILLIAELNQNSNQLRAEIHQLRSDAHVAQRMAVADSEFLLPARLKFEEAGGFGDLKSIEVLSPIEARRLQEFLTAKHNEYDDLFFQYQQGNLDDEYYDYRIAGSIRFFAPWWKKLGIFEEVGRRPSFDAEIKRLLSEESGQ